MTDLSTGKLLVHGRPVAGWSPDGVAMVFQHFGLLPWKTVYDNAAFGLAMAGVPGADIRARKKPCSHRPDSTTAKGYGWPHMRGRDRPQCEDSTASR